MAIFDWFRKSSETKVYNSSFAITAPNTDIKEQFKGEINKRGSPISSLREDIGEEHPFDFKLTEDLYKKFGFVTGVIDKYVDFVVGPGFYVVSEDERAKTIITQFMHDMNFDTLLRGWVKEALIKGNGFLELGGKKDQPPTGAKVLDANYIYVKRNDFGDVERYTQYRGRISKLIVFDLTQIAHIKFNNLADDAYGIGLVYPALNTINNLLGNEKDMHMLMRRKANAPFHVKVGNIEHNIMPTKDQISQLGKDLEWLHNKHEWVTDAAVEMKVLDFGNIGEKFDAINRYDLDMLFFTFQVPEVLMGRGSIPEGLAKVQLEAFERRIQSMQAEIEKIIETQIFNRVLVANGITAHVEFEWGQESESRKVQRIDSITKILQLFSLQPKLRTMLESELAVLLNLDSEILMDPEEEREFEETQPQPIVPGSKRSRESIPGNNFVEYLTEVDEYPLKEFVGFNYLEYLKNIFKFIESKEFPKREYKGFEFVPGTEQKEWREVIISYDLHDNLSEKQINRLRLVLKNGLGEGASIRQIAADIKDAVKPEQIGNLSTEFRSLQLARTEVVRAANEGALKTYSDQGIKRVEWISGGSERTCARCESMNGKLLSLEDAKEQIPVHSNCRCNYVPVMKG